MTQPEKPRKDVVDVPEDVKPVREIAPEDSTGEDIDILTGKRTDNE